MALIECPRCGKQISDKSIQCIHCGEPIVRVEEDENNRCLECGQILSETDDICPSCGCPVQKEKNDNVEEKPQMVEVTSVHLKKKTKNLLIIVFLIIAAIIAGVLIKKSIDERNTQIATEKAEEEARIKHVNDYNRYIDTLKSVQMLMILNGASAEKMCNLTIQVWRACIYHEPSSETNKYALKEKEYKRFGDNDSEPTSAYYYRDFNEGLSLLLKDKKETIDSIDSGLDDVKKIMADLKEVPEGLEECYTNFKNTYDAYKDLCNLATNPTGSYQTYNDAEQDAVARFLDYYEDLTDSIPEKLSNF